MEEDVGAQASSALANPKIREMLERFRSEGPHVLEEYANDPSVRTVLESLSMTAQSTQLPLPLPPQPIMHQAEYKNDYDNFGDEDEDDYEGSMSILSSAQNTNLTESLPVRGTAEEMMMQLDGAALSRIENQGKNNQHYPNYSYTQSASQEPIMVSPIIVGTPDHDASYINDLRLKAGIEFSDVIDDSKRGEENRPLRLVIGVGDGESLILLSKIINKCCGANCRIKVLLGRGSGRALSDIIAKDVMGWAAISQACKRERTTRGLTSPQVQFFKVEDDYEQGTVYPLHEKLADWADAFLILPMDAPTLAYASIGHPGDPTKEQGCLVLRLLRCWDPMKAELLVGIDVRKKQARSPITKDQVVKLGKLLPNLKFLKWGEGSVFDETLSISARAQVVIETLSTISGGYTWGVKSDDSMNETDERANSSLENELSLNLKTSFQRSGGFQGRSGANSVVGGGGYSEDNDDSVVVGASSSVLSGGMSYDGMRRRKGETAL